MSGSSDPLRTVDGDVAVERVSSENSIVTAVIDAVMATTGADEPPDDRLYESVDPDILEWLTDGTNDRSVRIAFEFGGCEVTVRGDGLVTAVNAGERAFTDTADGDVSLREPFEESDPD